MRILNLDLIAYGPFSGRSLDFQDGAANLHIIYGPNEAGKSCTLRALSNVLYGIPRNTQDAFLHPYDDLRIGLTLESGQAAIRVVRRKGGANSLRRGDGSDAIFPPAEWSALLPVEERDLFDRMFGVDHAEIARGGELLLSSGSDLGAMLFAAAGGVDRLRAVQAELQDSADELFRKSASKPHINKAISEWRTALGVMKQSQLVLGEYKHLRDSAEEAESEARRLEGAINEASLEEQRLRRLQQAFPLVAKRQQRIEQLKQHEGSRTLAADFEDRYRKAHDALRRAESEAASHARDIEGLRAKIDTTPITPGLVEHESGIDLLYQESSVVKKGVDDRVRRQQSLENVRADAAALLESIGSPLSLEEAAGLRVPDPAQKRIFTLGASKQAVDQNVAASARELEKAREEKRKASEELTGLAVTVDTGALEEALALVPPGGDLEEKHLRLSNELSAARIELESRVSALPGWCGTLEALAAAPVPLLETITKYQASFADRAAEEKRLLEDRKRLNTERDQVERDLRRIEQEQEVPTEQDLAASRKRRDEEWRTIRRAWLDSVAVDGPGLASSFETSIITSDQIADRLRREAARVSEKAALLVRRERLGEQSAGLELQREAGLAAAAALQEEWAACWSAAAVAPLTPLEMQSWLRQRDLILTENRELQQRQAETASLQESIQAIRRALLPKLEAQGGGAIDAGTPLRAIVAQAKRAVAQQMELRQRSAALQGEVQRAGGVIAELEERLTAANATLATWRSEWSGATRSLPIRPDASPEEVQVLLERITSLMVKIDEAGKLGDRIRKINKDEADFSAKVRALMDDVRLAIPLDNPVACVVRLHAELQQDRTNRDLIKTFVEQLEEKQNLLGHAQGQAVASNALLADLCHEAGAEAPDSLPECIEKATAKRKLSDELAETESTLTGFAGGGTIEQLVLDVEALDVDELPNRIARIQQQIDALRKEKAARDQSLGASRLELKQKEDADSAGQAAENAEHLHSRIANLTEDYVRLRLASRVLANAVERYRDRNQGPLLKTAATLFRQLTGGSFDDLRVDWNDQGEAGLMGIRGASQKQVGVEGMSEATRDQLFLALRLAYVLNYCESHGPVPFIADDVLMTFDDARATAALHALETLSQHTQVLLFTHHRHHLDLAHAGLAADAYRVHHLGD